jgi:L-threonylcarbamoyladenylate synthase
MRVVPPTDVTPAARAIEAGHLVIVPTNRWYMICCDAGNADACASIFTAKQRPVDKSLLLVAPTAAVVQEHFQLTVDAERLANAFWPGDLALRLPWRDLRDAERYAPVGTPEALVTQAPGILGDLAMAANCFVAATTANRSGNQGPGPSISLAEVNDFLAQTNIDVPVIIDGGICPTANHLTIVRCTPDGTETVREGAIHHRAITAALKNPDLAAMA